MVGQGVLRECLLDPEVELVQTIGRSATGKQHARLKEIVHQDLFHYEAMESELAGYDACFFCLGVSSAGMSEEDYFHLTFELTITAAATLARLNPQMTFLYISGAGTDTSEHGRSMWARVKGKTENELLRMPFRAAYMLRPGIIQPLHGSRSKTPAYRFFYGLAKPLLPILRRLFPNSVLTTEEIGRAMIEIARHGASKRILESRDIREVLVSRAARA